MARIGAYKTASTHAVPIIESFTRANHDTVSVGTSVVAVPTTNMSYRRGLFVQNNHASNGLYVGSCDPEFILGSNYHRGTLKASGLLDTSVYTFYDVKWVLSAGGTNEWYAVASTGSGTPSITEPTILYYSTSGGGTETLATNGTVGILSANNWGYGDGDTLGYDTLYIRTGGNTAAYNPALIYDFLMMYPLSLTADTTTGTGGLQIDAGSTMFLTLDGAVRLFGVASGASTPVGVMEVA